MGINHSHENSDSNSKAIPDAASPAVAPSSAADHVLVCGLGSLGQHCVVMLKEFGVTVSAIELSPPDAWEIPVVPQLLHHLWVGDCRQTELLKQAGIKRCRAVLLVTKNERVNIEAAFEARLLNPGVRLVARSAKYNLNELLGQQLGNFAAFEPTQLSAPAFALAAIDEAILGFFYLNDQLFQVIRHSITAHHSWCQARKVHELNTRTRRVLSYVPKSIRSSTPSPRKTFQTFHQWAPAAKIEAGDELITIEATYPLIAPDATFINRSTVQQTERTGDPSMQPIGERKIRHEESRGGPLPHLIWWPFRQMEHLKTLFARLWAHTEIHQIRRVAFICGLTVLSLLIIGTLLFWLFYPNISLVDAFFATVVLLLGGYGDRFDDFGVDRPIPTWLRLFGLILTLAGTAFVGVLYALLTEKLLTLRLQFLERRPAVPLANHVVVIGLGRVGQQVIRLLQQLKQPLVGVAERLSDPALLPETPIATGTIHTVLAQVNLASAQSVVAVTDDEMQNLELGLMVHAANPDSRLVIRTYDQRFSDRIARLFPYAQVLCASALSAEAFVAAAFGENVLSLFRLDQQTVLVTDYRVEADDTLHDRLLADIAYGYGVVPLVYEKAGSRIERLMPPDDLRVRVGDRLIVLATIDGLQQIEKGESAPRQWYVRVEEALNPNGTFEGATEIALITGCSIETAHNLMAQLPASIPLPLYHHQAQHLVRKLRKAQVMASAYAAGQET